MAQEFTSGASQRSIAPMVATKIQAFTETLTPEDQTAIEQFVHTLARGDTQGAVQPPGGWTAETLAQAQGALPASLTAKAQQASSTLSTEEWAELNSWLSAWVQQAADAGDGVAGYIFSPPAGPGRISSFNAAHGVVPGGPLAALLFASGGAVAAALHAAAGPHHI